MLVADKVLGRDWIHQVAYASYAMLQTIASIIFFIPRLFNVVLNGFESSSQAIIYLTTILSLLLLLVFVLLVRPGLLLDEASKILSIVASVECLEHVLLVLHYRVARCDA